MTVVTVGALVFGVVMAGSQLGPNEQRCYDALVTARIVEQVPTVMDMTVTDSDREFYIIHSWPWILDLAIQRVRSGEVSGRRVRVLSVQHTYFVRRSRDYYLRKNDLGGYNLVRAPEENPLSLCPAETPPARAYYIPGDGKTLEDARREGLRRYRE